MPQRPEDYQSGKNVGGNKLGGTGAGHNDPFDYLKGAIGKDHGYLGHFKQEKFLRKGHNTGVRAPGTLVRVAPNQGANAAPRVDVVGGAPEISSVFPAPPVPSQVFPAPTTQTAPGVLTPAIPGRTNVAPGLQAPTGRSRFLAEHPVVAARRAVRQTRRAGTNVSPTQALDAIRAARATSNSAYSEARARRAKRGIY